MIARATLRSTTPYIRCRAHTDTLEKTHTGQLFADDRPGPLDRFGRTTLARRGSQAAAENRSFTPAQYKHDRCTHAHLLLRLLQLYSRVILISYYYIVHVRRIIHVDAAHTHTNTSQPILPTWERNYFKQYFFVRRFLRRRHFLTSLFIHFNRIRILFDVI